MEEFVKMLIVCIPLLIVGLLALNYKNNKYVNYEKYKNLFYRIKKKERKGNLVPKHMYDELNRLAEKINED